jgi:hypothetical protein
MIAIWIVLALFAAGDAVFDGSGLTHAAAPTEARP